MERTEKFCLRWNDFESNLSESFRELREEKDFFDVTLACDDSQIQAHKVVISACSPFFRNVLRRNPHQHPLLYLKGVKYKELLSILNFMYMGEVNIAKEELNCFLAVADDLKVKGLTQTSADITKRKLTAKPNQTKQANRQTASQDKELLNPSKRQRASCPPTAPLPNVTNTQQEPEDEIQEAAAVKTEASEPQVTLATVDEPASSEQELPHTKYQHCDSVVLEDSFVVDGSFEFNQGDNSAFDDSLTEMNVDMTGTGGNTGITVEPPTKDTNPKKNPKQKKSHKQETKIQIQPTTPVSKPKEKKEPIHSYKRFGSAWQCEKCKTLFSRQSYAIEHMEEEEDGDQ